MAECRRQADQSGARFVRRFEAQDDLFLHKASRNKRYDIPPLAECDVLSALAALAFGGGAAKLRSVYRACSLRRKAVINNLNGFHTEFNYLCHPVEMNKSHYVLLFYLEIPGGGRLRFCNFQTMLFSLWLA